MNGRNILTWAPKRSAFASGNADAEAAKILHLLAKNNDTTTSCTVAETERNT